jgi:2',3'-cyclic-nucleotide 2'-phosphodiesterase
MRILFLGDIVGRHARRAIRTLLRQWIRERNLDFVIANGENAAGGKGIDPDSADELLDAGVDVLTSGNHVWQHKNIIPWLERDDRLLRPANYPENNPGRGWAIRSTKSGTKVAVVNLIGRAFMGPADCPFRTADRLLPEIAGLAKVIVVDMHAEATAEKNAMGWYLAGKVSAVLGSHTHVQTADQRILPPGTAFVTDAGMCGPINSIIGMRKDEVLRRFVTQLPARFEVANGPIVLQGMIVDIAADSGRALAIERLQEVAEA